MQILLAATALLALLTLLTAAWVIGRHLLAQWLAWRVSRKSHAIQAFLERQRSEGYENLDRTLFELRDSFDLSLLAQGLSDELLRGPAPGLTRGFELLQLTPRYLEQVRRGRTWRERARAATTLGLLAEPSAVVPLLEAMRDPRENTDVKLACAEALGRIQDDSIIPVLCAQLEVDDEWSAPRIARVLTTFGGKAVSPLLDVLSQTHNLNARIWAAQVLGQLRDGRVVRALTGHLTDRSEQVRMSIVNALGAIGDASASRALVDVLLRDPVSAVRAQAATALGRVGSVDALPLLVHALGSADYWMRFRALEAIEELAPTDVSFIESALADSNPEVRMRAALALERLGHLDRAFDALRSDDGDVYAQARIQLIEIGRAGLGERMARYLHDDDPKVRARMCSLFGEIGKRERADGLLPLLDDPAQDVRIAAIGALGAIARPDTAAALLRFLDSEDSDLRDAATQALLRYDAGAISALLDPLVALVDSRRGETRAAALRLLACGDAGERVGEVAALLINALGDTAAEVRLRAAIALGARAERAATAALGARLHDASDVVALAAADALGAIDGDEAIALLVGRVPDANPAQRESICTTLADRGFDALEETLDVLLATDTRESRVSAIWVLGKTGDERAAPLLVLALRDDDPKVRASAAGALGKIPCYAARVALTEALSDPDPFARAAAVGALVNQGDALALAPLRTLLADPDPFLRARVALAVGMLGGAQAHEALEAVPPDVLPDHVMALAMGLCGTPDSVATSAALMRRDEVRRAVYTQLCAPEMAPYRERLLACLHPDAAIEFEVQSALADDDPLAPTALASNCATTLRNRRDPETRRRAAAILSQLGGAETRAALLVALRQDPDIRVREIAIQGLVGAQQGERASDAVLAALDDPAPTVRVRALQAMGAIGHELGPLFRERLFSALRSSEPSIASAAESALASVCADAVQVVHGWTAGQAEPGAIAAGLNVLGRIADPRSIEFILPYSARPNAKVRRAAVRSLGSFRDPAVAPALRDTLSDPDEAIRAETIATLARVERDPERLIDRLATAIDDPSLRVRRTLAVTLAELSHPAAIEALAQFALDESPEVGGYALYAMLTAASPAGQERFLDQWELVAEETRAAARALCRMELVERLDVQLTEAVQVAARKRAIEILAAFDADGHRDRIVGALRDASPEVRALAARVVSMGSERLDSSPLIRPAHVQFMK